MMKKVMIVMGVSLLVACSSGNDNSNNDIVEYDSDDVDELEGDEERVWNIAIAHVENVHVQDADKDINAYVEDTHMVDDEFVMLDIPEIGYDDAKEEYYIEIAIQNHTDDNIRVDGSDYVVDGETVDELGYLSEKIPQGDDIHQDGRLLLLDHDGELGEPEESIEFTLDVAVDDDEDVLNSYHFTFEDIDMDDYD